MQADFATMGFAPYPRAELRAQLMQMRAERCSAMPEAMLEVIDRASSWPVATTAIGPATSLLAHDLKLLAEGLQRAAAAAGLHHEIRNIGGQAHG